VEELGCIAQIVVQDLAQMTSQQQYDSFVHSFSANKDIALLVNNAGLTHLGVFADNKSPDLFEKLVILNCFHPVFLTRALLPQMLERPQRSGVLNVSSVAPQGSSLASPYTQPPKPSSLTSPRDSRLS